MSSYKGKNWSKAPAGCCPFLIIVRGDPFCPSLLHGLCISLKSSDCLLVEVNLIEFPNLPSIITSPSWGYKFLISLFSLKILPNFILLF